MANEQSNSILQACAKAIEGRYGPLTQALFLIFLVIIFNYFIKSFLHKIYNHYANKQKIWKSSFISALYKPLSYYVWFLAIVISLDLLSSSLGFAHLPQLHLMLSLAGVLALGWFFLRWNKKATQAMLEQSHQQKIALTPSKLDLLSKLATITIIFFTILLLLEVSGRSVQTLIAFGGIGGVALAFASQQVISNFFGGLMVYLTHPFSIGEQVNIPERKIEGKVEEIGWYMTRIRSADYQPIYVPNSIFAQAIVITPSRMSHFHLDETIGIRYADVKKVEAIVEEIKKMLYDYPHIDHHQKIDVHFSKFGPHALDLEISAFIAKTAPIYFNAVKQDVLLKIASIIESHEAEIAPPT